MFDRIRPYMLKERDVLLEVVLAVAGLFISPFFSRVLLAIALGLITRRYASKFRAHSQLGARFSSWSAILVVVAITGTFYVGFGEAWEDFVYARGSGLESPRNRWVSWHEYEPSSTSKALLVEYSANVQPVEGIQVSTEINGLFETVQIFISDPGLTKLEDAKSKFVPTGDGQGLSATWNDPQFTVVGDWLTVSPTDSLYIYFESESSDDLEFVAGYFGGRSQIRLPGVRPVVVGDWEYWLGKYRNQAYIALMWFGVVGSIVLDLWGSRSRKPINAQ